MEARVCEYCDDVYRRELRLSSSDRFCSSGCRFEAWEGGNPNVMAVDGERGSFFVELPLDAPYAVLTR